MDIVEEIRRLTSPEAEPMPEGLRLTKLIHAADAAAGEIESLRAAAITYLHTNTSDSGAMFAAEGQLREALKLV